MYLSLRSPLMFKRASERKEERISRISYTVFWVITHKSKTESKYIFLTQIVFCILEIFKTNVSTSFNYKITFLICVLELFCGQQAGVKCLY